MRYGILAILLALASSAPAADFAPAEYFDGFWQPQSQLPADARKGQLFVPMEGEEPPHFVSLNNSDRGPAVERFEKSPSGLLLVPLAERESCESEIEVVFDSLNGEIRIVELEIGASLAFHICGPGSAESDEFLVQVKRSEDAVASLRLLKRARNGFTELDAATLVNTDWKKHPKLEVSAASGAVSGSFNGKRVEARAAMKNGISLGVSASDGRGRVKRLEIKGELNQNWCEYANARLQARKALLRLNEFCTQSLLAGVWRSKHPSQDTDLAKYSDSEFNARANALADTNLTERLSRLVKIAAAQPALALARHEAGVSALLAGDVQTGRSHLAAALEIKECSLTRLALAEACRRLRQFLGAEEHLAKAKTALDEQLQPDYELLRGRLLAARGDIAGADRVLSAAHAKWPAREEIAAFAQSAHELASPSLTALSVSGPFSLTFLSDLDEDVLAKLGARLKPFADRIRFWLPGLEAKLSGTIAIYNGPMEYLRAALIVADDNLDNIGGMYLPTGILGTPSIIACRAFGEEELFRTLVHELWHLAAATIPAGAAMPAWLNEGMAVYISAAEVTADKSLRFTSLPAELSAALLDKALDEPATVEAMLEADGAKFYLSDNQRLRYALSWALVWYHAQADLAAERTLKELIANKGQARQDFKKGLAALLPRVKKMLKDRKII